MQVQPLDLGDPLGKVMGIHSSILVWRIPWTRSLVGYSTQGFQESDLTEVTEHTHTHRHTQMYVYPLPHRAHSHPTLILSL